MIIDQFDFKFISKINILSILDKNYDPLSAYLSKNLKDMNVNQLEVISEVKCSELGAQNLKSGTESASKYNSSMAPMGTESSKML